MGYLNTQPDDDYNLQTMGQGGNVTTELPGASGLQGLLTTVPKALTAAGAAVGGLAQDALKDTPVGNDVRGLFNSIDTANDTLKPLLGYAPLALGQEQRDSASAATAVMSKWAATGEDPRVTGALGRTVFGLFKALGIIAGATPVVGPWGAAALYGSTEARGSYQTDIAAGIDPTAAAEKAAVAGAVGFGGAALPIGGSTLAAKIAAGVAGNVGLDIAGRTASWGVLKANGYNAQADQQKIFDGQSIMADVIMGAAFGAHSHLTGGHAIKPAEVNPADVDTSAAVLAQGQFEHSAPGVPVDPAAANTHVRVMSEALDSVANGDTPNVSAEDARTLAEGTLPDPVHDTAAQITEAAHAELPGFTDAVAPIKEIEPPARAAAEPLGQIPPDAEGKPAPAQFDDITQQRIDRLTSKYGDLQITDDNGETQSVSQVAKQMQNEMADADNLGKAHEAAAACFMSTGGAA
jgi:hypothetical protein